MGIDSVTQRRSTGEWSPRLFLGGGLLLVGHAAMLAVETFGAVSVPPDVFAPTGHLLAVLGLVGLAGTVGRRWRRGLRALGLVTLVGWTFLTGAQATRFLGVAPDAGLLPDPVAMALLVLTTLTYGLVAFAGYRAGAYGPVVAGLVAAPGVLLVALVVNGAVLGAPPVGTVLVATGLAVSQLGVGTALRYREPTRHGAAAPGAVRG
jgi:hypothetical protein